MLVNPNPVPYRPVDARHDEGDARRRTRPRRSTAGSARPRRSRAPTGRGRNCSAANPFPGTPDPTQICLKSGFDPTLLYQVVFTAQGPLRARHRLRRVPRRRRRSSRTRPATTTARRIRWRGRHLLGDQPRPLAVGQLPPGLPAPRLQPGRGRPQGARRRLADHRGPPHRAELPLRDARRRAEALRSRAAKARSGGCHGPIPCAACRRAGILDRCTASNTCPKIIEHFGAAEVWGLKLTPELVGTTADTDIPLPANVRRYYIPSTPARRRQRRLQRHSAGGAELPRPELSARASFAANPVPHTRDGQRAPVPFPQLGHERTSPPPPEPAGPRPCARAAHLVDPTKEAHGVPDDSRRARRRRRPA